MTRRARILTVLTATVLLAGCGAARTDHTVANLAAKPGCSQAAGQNDAGDHDTDPPASAGQGGADSVDYAPVHTGQYLEGYEAVAVVQVVSRAGGMASADDHQLGARPFGPQTAPAAATAAREGFKVLRPTRLAVIRLLKGQLPPCLDLDVPGGTAGLYQYHASQFPAAFGPGDKMLGLFSTHDQPGPTVPAYAQTLLKADPDGNLTLPFGDRDQINVNTWTPPPSQPPPSQPPPSTQPNPCWTPGQPPPSPTSPPPCGRGSTP